MANDKPFFTYSDIQAMGGHPLVGGGIRFKDKRLSLDFSGNFLPNSKLTSLVFHTKAQLLFYLWSNLYIGAGLGLLNEPATIKGLCGSLESCLGLELHIRKSNHFFLEFGAVSPFKKPQDPHVLKIWPSLTFGYGF